MNAMQTNYRNANLSDRSAISQVSMPTQFDLLRPIRNWLDEIKISDPQVAKFIYKAIPAQCPFARDIKLFDRTILHIPPLCKLNPLYDQLIGLRFRALCYLVDECGMDILSYS